MECKHVARNERNAGRIGILIKDPGRRFKRPNFGWRDARKPPCEIVSFPAVLASYSRCEVIFELEFPRIANIRDLKVNAVTSGCSLCIPDIVSVPGRFPDMDIPQQSSICWLVMNDNSHSGCKIQSDGRLLFIRGALSVKPDRGTAATPRLSRPMGRVGEPTNRIRKKHRCQTGLGCSAYTPNGPSDSRYYDRSLKS